MVDTSHVPDELLTLPTLVVDIKVHMTLQPEHNVHSHDQMVLVLVKLVTQVLLFLGLHVETYKIELVFSNARSNKILLNRQI